MDLKFEPRAHDHAVDGVVLCPVCDSGQWIVGTRDGAAYLIDLDDGWVATLTSGDGADRLPGPCWLRDWVPARRRGTLSMCVSPMLGGQTEMRVRTYWIDDAEPAGAAPSFARNCWARGLLPAVLIAHAADSVDASKSGA